VALAFTALSFLGQIVSGRDWGLGSDNGICGG